MSRDLGTERLISRGLMEDEELGIYDAVSIVGEQGRWTVVGTRSDGLFEVQLGNDAGTKKFVKAAMLKGETQKHAERNIEDSYETGESRSSFTW